MSIFDSTTPEYRNYLAACRNTRRKAPVRALSHDLTSEQIKLLWLRCSGKCEVSGIAFDVSCEDGRHKRRPWAPSLDRVDSAIGYTFSNVRVVCVAVNLAMNQWGVDVLYKIAVNLFAHGTIQRTQAQTTHAILLPEGVSVYRGLKMVRYKTRVRDFGLEKHLGSFSTLAEALDAQTDWAIKNDSLKVLQLVHNFT